MTDRGAEEARKQGTAVRQLIGFRLGPERFGIDISRIHEIIKPLPLTVVPDMPGGFSGVIYLRDQVIVIADLHARFGFPKPPEATKDARIIVLAGMSRKIGIVVDGVSEVVRLTPAMLDPSPAFTDGVSVEFIEAIGKLGDDLMAILDVDALLPDAAASEAGRAAEEHMAAEAEANARADASTPAAPPVDPGLTLVEEEVMEELGRKAETGTNLYQDIGDLARFINMAHKTFAQALPKTQNIKLKAKDLPTANDLLNKVTEDTETATMQVMANTEETVGIVSDLDHLVGELEAAVPASASGRAAVSDLAERMRSELGHIQNVQDDTIMALSFQDLTGQKIKQVIALMGEVEERILKLVVAYGAAKADQATETVEQRLQDLKEDETVSGLRQDRVDDLLAEFGF
jgi:purine-binding chemotaxis protein CheW